MISWMGASPPAGEGRDGCSIGGMRGISSGRRVKPGMRMGSDYPDKFRVGGLWGG